MRPDHLLFQVDITVLGLVALGGIALAIATVAHHGSPSTTGVGVVLAMLFGRQFFREIRSFRRGH